MKNSTVVKNIILAKGTRLYRKYFSELLESNGFKVIGLAATEAELFELLKTNKPDILIYDIFLTSSNFEITIKKIISISPDTKLIVTGEDYSVIVESAMSLGASGFFDEDILDIDIILDAIKRIGSGETVTLTRENAV